MKLTKPLLSVASALALTTGAAFAGSMQSQSVEAGGPELLSGAEWPVHEPEPFAYPMNSTESPSAQEPEVVVMTIYPMEVTEYYRVAPDDGSETPPEMPGS